MSDPIAAQPTAPIVEHTDIMYPSAIPFVLVHLACVAALWTGVTYEALGLCFVLYWLRIFAIGAGYHRYFSHRAYRTSRAFQFALAVLSQSTAQKSVLWWASKHRHHHLHSDTETDVHSPRHKGFVYSHLGWIFSRKNDAADLVKIADFARYPELMWLHKHELVPPAVLAVLSILIAGWSGLVVGFFWSTVLVYHATFCINSLAHVAAAGAMSPVTIRATIGCWRWSPWAKAGTTITTPIRVASARAFAGVRSTRPSTCSRRCRGPAWCGT